MPGYKQQENEQKENSFLNNKPETRYTNKDNLEQRTDELMEVALKLPNMIGEKNYAGALFLLDNLPENTKTDAFYGYLAVSLSNELDNAELGEKTQKLAENCLEYCIDKCGYFSS